MGLAPALCDVHLAEHRRCEARAAEDKITAPLREQLAVLQDAFNQSVEHAEFCRREHCETLAELVTAREILSAYPKGQDDGTWYKRKDAFLKGN